jgi:DNA-binding NarL/FixJ family response regulator
MQVMDINEVETLFSKSEYTEIAEKLSLSPREIQIIGHMLMGDKDKQIAQNLNIAVPTVRTHISRIFSKLDVNDKNELIVHVFSQFRKGCCDKGCPRKKITSNKMTSKKMTP